MEQRGNETDWIEMNWFTIQYQEILWIILSGIGIYIALMVAIRLNGLRTLSKMSSHDFAVTVALGTIVASVTIQSGPSLLQGVIGMAILIVLQFLYSLWRLKRPSAYLENEPLILMQGPNILWKNMKQARISEGDLLQKLREANVHSFDEIDAVILEVTGDVSVLHGGKEISPFIIRDVQGKPVTPEKKS